ncbi:unnamed protein product [Didymodactylos carnosus]|uniref:Uncharacterized protein n=1 Tax=Didymodactylos carnosus TaxID=1234261 RepID=A0A815I5U7_9BILA|nr:unnamed protein product [Didymodactylos carnosus]CAF1363385.1 unnamed protein product [Didymodactylos carnosus]CAF3912647.1 unnamed protein product [Didymodactylos carnosus]CAF4243684.1 unnamed protein product [Didymodactylos carnosus]
MSGAMKLKYLIAGVNEPLKLYITLHNPKTPETFLSFARKVEDALSLSNIRYGPSQRTSNTNNTVTQQSTVYPSNPSPPSYTYQQASSYQLPQQQSSYDNKYAAQSCSQNTSYSNRSRNLSRNQQPIICYTCGAPGPLLPGLYQLPFPVTDASNDGVDSGTDQGFSLAIRMIEYQVHKVLFVIALIRDIGNYHVGKYNYFPSDITAPLELNNCLKYHNKRHY